MLATLLEVYRTCSVWRLGNGRFGVRGYTVASGSERDASFDPTWGTADEARHAIDDFLDSRRPASPAREGQS